MDKAAEPLGYIIITQYKNPLNKIVQKVEREVFKTSFDAQDHLADLVKQNPEAMRWICEIPLLEWKPRLIAIK